MNPNNLTSPVAGSGEDRRMTAEIFMMLQRDATDPSGGGGLNQDVVNAVMQDPQAPADILEEQQQFQHHQRMHQLQLLQQQQVLQQQHHGQHQQAQQQYHQQQQQAHHHNQHNLWEQQQQQQQHQYHDQYQNYQQQQVDQQAQYQQQQQAQAHAAAAEQDATAKKPNESRKKKTGSPSKKQLPTAGAAPAAAADAMGVVADAAAVVTAAAVAEQVQPAPVAPPQGPPGKYSVGTFVTKHFPFFGWFQGRIIHWDFDNKLYKIQYQDGDLEELDEKEITLLMERAERAKPANEQNFDKRGRPKRRARYQEGTKIKKLFYGFGWFEGTVEGYDDETEFYHVVYEDGDKEDLDEEEVYEILMDPKNHKKPRTWTTRKLSKKEKEEYSKATFDPIQTFWLPIPPPPPPPPPPAKYPNGTEIYKFFTENGWYKGKVIDFDPASQFYQIRYEDKDEEDMEEHEIEKAMAYAEYGPIGKYSVGKEIKKNFPGHGLFKGKIIKYDPVLRLYKIQYEDKDKEDLDEKELTKIMKKCKEAEEQDAKGVTIRIEGDGTERQTRKRIHYL